MTWDIAEKIIVAVIVAASAVYLALRAYRSVFHKGRMRGICADCPTRSRCEAELSRKMKNKPLESCPRRNLTASS